MARYNKNLLAMKSQNEFRRFEAGLARISNQQKGIYGGNPRLNVKQSFQKMNWEMLEPMPDIYSLFDVFDTKFFQGRLSKVELEWSKHMYKSAGTCYQLINHFGTSTIIRLSEPILKLRSRTNLIETLLHEMIHAYLFILDIQEDNGGHGPYFQKIMTFINKAANVNIQLRHSFDDEVEAYSKYVWRCDGICQYKKPTYGWIRQVSERAPGLDDPWWIEHEQTCGGQFRKIPDSEHVASHFPSNSGETTKETCHTPIDLTMKSPSGNISANDTFGTKLLMDDITEISKDLSDAKNEENTSTGAERTNNGKAKSISCYVMKTPTATASSAQLNDEDMKSLFAAGFSPSVIVYLRKESMRKECNSIILDEIDAKNVSKMPTDPKGSQQGDFMDVAESEDDVENEGHNSISGGSEGGNAADSGAHNGRNGNTNTSNTGNNSPANKYTDKNTGIMSPGIGNSNNVITSQGNEGDFEISIQKIIEESKNRAKLSKQMSAKSITDDLTNRSQPTNLPNALNFIQAQNGTTNKNSEELNLKKTNHIDSTVDSGKNDINHKMEITD